MGILSSIGDFLGGALGILFKPISKLLKKWLLPDAPSKEALTLPREGSNVSIPIVYGRRKVGGIVVDKNVTDGDIEFNIAGVTITVTGGDKNALLHLLVVFSHGECESIDEFQFNGKPSTDPQFQKKGGGTWFDIETRLGGVDNDVAVDGVGRLNNFSTVNSKYEGLCFALITLQQDKDQTVWRGIPEITAIIRGKRCFDWRTTTTQYTENAAVHLVDYMKSPIYGKSINDVDINYPYFTAVADSSDIVEETNTIETLQSYYDRELNEYLNLPPVITTETFVRFTNNNIIDTQRTIFENMQELSNAFRGYFPEPDGRIAIGSEDVATSVFSFDGDNIIGKITRSTTSRNERFNRVIVKFANRLNDYESDEVYYPKADSQLYADWLLADNNIPLETTITADWCVYKAEAIQLAEVAVKVSRNSDQVNFLATLEAAELDIGDVIDITDVNRGWVNVEFRISELSFNDDGTVGIGALLHNNTVYPWTGKDYEERVGGIYLGDPTNIATPSNLQFTPDPNLSNTGELTWDHVDDAFSRGYKIEVLTVAAEPVVVVSGESSSKRFYIPLINQGDYNVEVSAISTLGTLSDAATLGLQLTTPIAPTAIIFETRDWDFEIQPTVAGGLGTGSTFEFDYVQGDGVGYTPTTRANGASYTATGLIPNTLYTAYARTVNAYGQSAWYSQSTTTTQVGAQVQPFIENIESELADAQLAIDDLAVVVDLNLDFTIAEIATVNTSIGTIETQAKRDRFQINTVFENTEEADLELLRGLTNDAQSREALRQTVVGDRVLIDAVVVVNPETGEIINRAFSYSDGLFTQAELRIDGVEGQVVLAVDRIETSETEISGLSSQLALVPAQITATATAIVSESIAALEPAFTFNFFDSAQNWVAVNGTVTPETNQIAVAWGDIENASLGYDAAENKLFRILLTRTGGTGWNGSVIIERDNATTETFTNIIVEPASGAVVILVDFSGLAQYSGTITGVRLILGTSAADTFDITSITIGKADATTQDLQNLTARITTAELDIDANEGAITQRVTITNYDSNTVTFSNVETTVDGLNSIITLEATRQSLITNDTIATANTALIEVNALDGTVTTLSETVTTNQETNNTSFTQVQSELDSVDGSITNNTFAIITNEDVSEEGSLLALIADIDIAKIRKLDIDQQLIFADAIQQLNVDVGETGALAESILNLTAVVNINDVAIVATADRVTRVETDVLGNATAIDQLDLEVIDITAGLNSSLTRIDTVEIDASNNATSIASLDLRVDSTDSNVSGALTRIDTVEVDADNNAVSITNLTNRVTNTETDVTATNTRVDGVELTADGNATAISTVEGQVNNPELNTSALYTFAQSVETTADGNTNAITALGNRVTVNESFAASQIILNSDFDAELGTLSARAFLGVDINNRVSGINIQGEPDNSVIDFIGDKIRFIRPDTLTAAFEWDDVNDTFVFDGKIIAIDSTFTGAMTASTISGTTITGGAINGGEINGGVVIGANIKGALFQTIGTEYMIIQRATPFGANNLIEWYGSVLNNVDAQGDAILANLTKVNGITWKDSVGNAYTSGTIIAGTLTVSRQTGAFTNTPTIDTGVFASNGGQIAINCSAFASFGSTTAGSSCPATPPTPSIIIRLYDTSGGGNTLVNQETFTGTYTCEVDLEEGNYRQTYNVNGSFTFFDNGNNTSNRSYRTEATISNVPLNPTNDRNQRLSILTQEA
jgi:hypothetical protein